MYLFYRYRETCRLFFREYLGNNYLYICLYISIGISSIGTRMKNFSYNKVVKDIAVDIY